MKTGFSIAREDATWVLKVQGNTKEAKFGTLSAAMRCAYLLADDTVWSGNCDGALAEGS